MRLYCQVIVVAVDAQKAPQSDFQFGDGQVLATTVTSIAQIPPWVPDGPIQAVTTAGVQNGDGGPNPSFNASPIDDVTKGNLPYLDSDHSYSG